VSYSAGFTARPLNNVSITLDAYSIEIDDRVVLSGRFQATDPDIADLLEPFGVNGAQFFTNAIDTETQGLDLVAAWSTRVGSQGTYSLTGAFSWTSTDITNIRTPPELEGKEQTLFPVIDQVYVEEAQPGSSYSIGNRYTRGSWSGMLRFNYFGSVASTESNTDPARKQVFGGKWITDLDIAYTFSRGITLHVGGNNIFDVFPDENIASNSFNGIFVYPRRTAPFGFNGGYYYMNASFKF
jgi:iron complex outermembrane receptor protein